MRRAYHRPICGFFLLAGALAGCNRIEPLDARDSEVGRQEISAQRPGYLAERAGGPAVSRTFSIVAVDPETGICGAAVASMYPAVGSVVPFARGGVGAFCTQHAHHPRWGKRALELLEQGKPPAEVLGELLASDDSAGMRQLAIIDSKGRTANHNPSDARADSLWWGSMSGRFYACQGNTLCGNQVITAMAVAYENTQGSLADRLMAALVAGDCAGGDHRGRLAAGIVVAKPGAPGAWLELRVDKSDDAVLDLARKYIEIEHDAKGAWAARMSPWKHPCPDRPAPKPPQQEKRRNDEG
jgi:uncharacterized Ntn-hydrolase superfamily protein